MSESIVQQIKSCFDVSEQNWTAIYANFDLSHHTHYEEIAEAMQSIRTQHQRILTYTSQLYELNVHMMMKIVRLKEEMMKMQAHHRTEIQLCFSFLFSLLQFT